LRRKRIHSRLGGDLRKSRKVLGLTQAALALCAGHSVLAVRQAESGLGSMNVFLALASACGMAIDAKSLPPGSDLGGRLLALRTRLGLGRRAAAALADLSPTTVASIEGRKACHTDAVARFAAALGAPLTLVPVGAQPGFWSRAGTASTFHGWTTPPWLLEVLYSCVGGTFGLDPCSPVKRGAGAPVRARLRYTAQDDALTMFWRAPSVFMNPPYGRALGAWVAKARSEFDAGRAELLIALIPARTDTRWWHRDVVGSADIWMLRGRLSFGDGSMPAPFPSAVVVWGATAEIRDRLREALHGAWHVAHALAEG
jgi:transcriptional regulator with XRE-family HTH domain